MAKKRRPTALKLRQQILTGKRTQDVHVRITPELKRLLQKLAIESGDGKIATYIHRLITKHVTDKGGQDEEGS